MFKKIWNIILRISFFIAGLLFIVFAWTYYDDYARSKTWPETLGTITKSEITRNRKGLYCPYVNVRYSKNNNEKIAKLRFSHSPCRPSENMVKNILESFAVGTQHKVFYDPVFPEKVVLERGSFSWLFFVWLFISFPMFTLSIIYKPRVIK